MRLIVTVLEDTFERALDAIRSLPPQHDGIELRAEALVDVDLGALRASTTKPIVLTHRGRTVDSGMIARAVDAGIDFVDLEWQEGVQPGLHRERIVLSHHDFSGMADLAEIASAMLELGCGHTKLAVTPKTLDDNLRLLRLARAGLTLIGMGEQGLYSRILAPFAGSEWTFVASRESAAPGQLTLERARAIYGDDHESISASHVFAIAGSPAGHSLSPAIHNPLFRERRVDAAYTVASFPEFEPIAEAIVAGELRGVSITAPFKERALRWSEEAGASVAQQAVAAGAINTLVRGPRGLFADNTDVDGFRSLLSRAESEGVAIRSAALVGAGGTARAALVALLERDATVRVFNRTGRSFPIAPEPLHSLAGSFDVIIDTLPASADLRAGARADAAIVAAYPSDRFIDAPVRYSGTDLLHAQAARQNQIFIEAIP